jgi:serine/threonine protein kinase/WD40 repeat protein
MTQDAARDERLAQVLSDCSDRLNAGEPLDMPAVLSTHPDLLPELELALEALSGAHAPPRQTLELRSLGNHRIVGEIGRGGMGVVFEAVDLTLGRRVALKVLPGSQRMERGRRERFLREARAAARLHHTRIVPVFEVGEENGVLFYAMQYIPGRGLDRVLRVLKRLAQGRVEGESAETEDAPAEAIARGLAGSGSHPFSWPAYCRAAARIGSEVADALAHAHREGILHRDVKPSNLILDGQGSPWLADFGLAKSELETASLTVAGDVVGTVGYMPPERFGGEGDARSDIYSLGATLYEMLALRPPFEDTDRRRLLRMVLDEDPAPLGRVAPAVPRDLGTVIRKAMAREPSRRYSTAADLRDDLARFLRGEPIRARPAGPVERSLLWCRRNPLVSTLGASILFLLVVLLAVAAFSARSLRERLHESELARAQAQRTSGRPGRRFESLESIGRAARIRPSDGLRDEAIAALALADLREVLVRSGVPLPGATRVFDPDLERYAVPDPGSGLMAIRQIRSDEEIERLGDPEARESPLAFSPDGACLLSRFDRDGKRFFRLRRIAGGEVLLDRETDSRQGAFAFDTGGRLLACGEPDGSIALVELAARTVRRTFRPRSSPAWIGLALDPGKLLATGPPAALLEIFDLNGTGAPIAIEVPPGNFGGALSPDGRLLAVGNVGDAAIQLFRVDTGERWRALTGHLGGGMGVGFSPAGDLLASSSWDGTLRLWDPWNGDLLLTKTVSEGFARFSRDGRSLVLSGADRLRLLEVAPGAERRVLRSLNAPETTGGNGVAFHPTGRLLRATFGTWDLALLRELPGSVFPEAEYGYALHPDGRSLVGYSSRGVSRRSLEITRDGEGDVFRWGRPERIAGLAPGAVAFAFDASGRRLAAIASESRIVFLSWDRPGDLQALGAHPGADQLSVSADGRFVASGTFNRGRGIKVWDVEANRLVQDLETESSGHGYFDPRGRWLAIAVPEVYRFLRIERWEPARIHHRKSHQSLPGPLAWSPDGTVAALADTPSEILILDPETGEELGRFESSYPRRILSLAFSPDGGHLAAALGNTAVELWDLRRIRDGLRTLGLDLEIPSLATPAPAAPARPLRVETAEAPDAEGETGALDALLDPKMLVGAAGDLQRRGAWREAIRAYERAIDLAPDAADALNNLAWALLTGPGELRDPARGLALSERAVKAGGENHVNLNTLGAARYRTGAYREAIDTLLRGAELGGGVNAWDGFFIAMSLKRLELDSLARDYFQNAVRWIERHTHLAKEEMRELESIRREAAQVLGEGEATPPPTRADSPPAEASGGGLKR